MVAYPNKLRNFTVIIDDSFANACPETELSPIENKSVLGLANGFENNEWRYGVFHRFIWDNIGETALSHREREACVGDPETIQIFSANNLRLTDAKDDPKEGSELAEIALYGVMKHHYQALPVVPKIFHKQNVRDNAKGADGVHIVLEGDEYSFWFGEAKFYSSIADARLGDIVTSVGNSLTKEKLQKENRLMSGFKDLEDLLRETRPDKADELLASILADLDANTSIDKIIGKVHIPIFILYECGKTSDATEDDDEYLADIEAYQKDRAEAYFSKQIEVLLSEVNKYPSIHFHIILFPVPDKMRIVRRFLENVEHKKKQGSDY